MKPLLFVTFLCVSVSFSRAAIKKPEFWRGTPLDATVERMRYSCAENNGFACFQFKAFNFLDNVLQGGYFQFFTDNVHITRNGYENEIEYKRSISGSIEDTLENFVKSTEVSVDVPHIGNVGVSARNLDKNEVDIKVKIGNDEGGVEGRSKKHKIKKVFLPLASFLLLKAITVVPFIIGLLGIKAFNGLQLSFISFVIAAGMTIYTVCQKLVENAAHQHPVIVEHPLQYRQKRDLSYADTQKLAYLAYS